MDDLKHADGPGDKRSLDDLAISESPRRPQVIDYMKLPSAPAPFISADAGEVWAWGDFFLLLQKDPPAFINTKPELAKLLPFAFPITYPYALSAFYHLAKNPHGPSFGPVAVATIEKGVNGHLMLCMFTSLSHLNCGLYTDAMDVDTVRQKLFDLIRSQLGVSGQPHRIGVLKDAYGHPETGLPARLTQPDKPKPVGRARGCAGLLVLLFIVLCAWQLMK